MKAWVTKDLFCNQLALHLSEPYKCELEHVWKSSCKKALNKSYLPEDVNPQWSDDEPIEVKLKIERIKQ